MSVWKNIKGNKREPSENFGDFSITESPSVITGYSLIMSEYDTSLGKPVLKALQAGANIVIDSSPTDVVIAADLSAIPSLPTGMQGQTLTYDSTPSITATSQLRHTSVGQTAVGTIDSDNQDFQLLVSANGMYAGGSASVLISSMANEGMSQNKLLLSAPLSASARIETGTPSTQYYTDESSLVIDTEHLYFENSHLEASKSLALDADKKLITMDAPTIPVVSDIAYDATSWNNNLDAPSKNAIRDKIESLESLPSGTSGQMLRYNNSNVLESTSRIGLYGDGLNASTNSFNLTPNTQIGGNQSFFQLTDAPTYSLKGIGHRGSYIFAINGKGDHNITLGRTGYGNQTTDISLYGTNAHLMLDNLTASTPIKIDSEKKIVSGAFGTSTGEFAEGSSIKTFQVKIALTSANLLALTGSDATSITLVSAPGTNKMIVPISIVYKYSYGTTAYAPNGVTLGLRLGGEEIIDSGLLVEGTTGRTVIAYIGNDSYPNDPTDMINKALKFNIRGTTSIVDGDGTLIINCIYSIADFN